MPGCNPPKFILCYKLTLGTFCPYSTAMDLLKDTLHRMKHRPHGLTLEKIAADTGLGVPWLSTFQRGGMTDPGVTKVQALNRYLKTKRGKPRKVPA